MFSNTPQNQNDPLGISMTGKPLINDIIIPAPGTIVDSYKTGEFKQLMNWVKRTPEAIGIIKTITTDIITNINFSAVPERKTGRPSKDINNDKELKAKKFCQMNFFRNTLTSAMYDWFLGDAYLWKAKTKLETVKELVKKRYIEAGLVYKEIKDYKDFMDEDNETNIIAHVPMTSVTIKYDKENVKQYKQRVGTFTKIWEPNEIIHAKFMDLDGKAHGFSPMKSNEPIIKTLGMIKDYAGHFFEGGGAPDIVFNFPDSQANDPYLKQVESVIKEYRQNRKRAHMVMGGKLEIKKINEFDKDMEFRQLAIYYTGILAFSFQMPLSKMSQILGTEVKEGAAGTDNSNSGYQNNIKNAQKYWEDLLNTQLWVPHFGVEMKFSAPFLIDEIKETMNKINIADYVFKQNTVFHTYGKQISLKKVAELLDYLPEDLEDYEEEELEMEEGMPGNRQQQMTKKDEIRGSATEALSQIKKDQANAAIDRKPDRGSGD